MKFTILEDSFLVAQYHHKPTFLWDNKRSYIERKYAFSLCYKYDNALSQLQVPLLERSWNLLYW